MFKQIQESPVQSLADSSSLPTQQSMPTGLGSAFQQNVKGKYVRNALTKGESVIYEAKVSWARLAPLFLLAILTVMGILVIPLLIAMYRNIELALTNKRVIGKWGVLHHFSVEMNLNKIESVQIHQGLFGRMFNYGSIVISGAGNPRAPIPGIKDPMTLRRILLETQETIAGGSAYSRQAN